MTNNTRERIVEAADQLFYEQGFEFTSFAHIAQQVGISRGNFYHHFKTKDDILDAVIQRRLIKTQWMLETWESQANTPLECIRSFIDILVRNQSKILLFGCPVGTLNIEMLKLNHPAQAEAKQLFKLFSEWLAKQFSALGYEERANKLAMHLLALSQGVAVLASTFNDETFIQNEVSLIHDWLTHYTQTNT